MSEDVFNKHLDRIYGEGNPAPELSGEANYYLTRCEAELKRLTAEYSALQELAAEFVDSWLGDGDGTDLDGLAHRMAEALDRDSGREGK